MTTIRLTECCPNGKGTVTHLKVSSEPWYHEDYVLGRVRSVELLKWRQMH